MKKLSNYLQYCINFLFLLIISFVFLQASIFNSQYKYTILLFALTIGTLLLIFFFYQTLTKFERWICPNYKYIVAIFLIFMFIIQITLGLKYLRFNPSWDLSAVYNGAIDWLTNGNINEYKDYFYYYPNNFGALMLLKLIFSLAHFFSITDYFSVASIFNSFLNISMMYLIIRICSTLLGQKYGILSAFILTLCYPFYFISTVFYTDSLTMIFPTLIYYIYIKSKTPNSSLRKVLCYFCMILFTVIGMQIKFTVLIILFAIFIDLLLNYKIKTLLLLVFSTIIISSLVSSMMNSIVYPHLLDKAQHKNKIHLISVGL